MLAKQSRRVARVAAIALLVAFWPYTDAPAQQRTPTPESGIGVWYRPDAPLTQELWRPGDAGERLLLRARVLDTAGMPVADARVEIWHADANGQVHAERYRATLISDAEGRVRVSTVLPGYIWGPRHIHVVVTHQQHAGLITRLFFKRDPVVRETDRPDLAIILEDGRHQDAPALFGDIELVLRPR
jgi:protocatechuate 3,4-dioxygenase beta subunit